uniref:Uncharacterized protein n=1 Tax=Arundo donax TaxID=35708 RepID=A0A0A9ETJ1_ARUDO
MGRASAPPSSPLRSPNCRRAPSFGAPAGVEASRTPGRRGPGAAAAAVEGRRGGNPPRHRPRRSAHQGYPPH